MFFYVLDLNKKNLLHFRALSINVDGYFLGGWRTAARRSSRKVNERKGRWPFDTLPCVTVSQRSKVSVINYWSACRGCLDVWHTSRRQRQEKNPKTLGCKRKLNSDIIHVFFLFSPEILKEPPGSCCPPVAWSRPSLFLRGDSRGLYFLSYYLNGPGKCVGRLHPQFMASLATPLIRPLK